MLNLNIWIYWIWITEFDIIWSHFYWPFSFACKKCTTWLLCIWRTLFCFIFGFRIPDSDFPFPAFRVARKSIRTVFLELWSSEGWNYNPGQKTSGHLSNFGQKVENWLYILPSLYGQCVFFFRCLFCAPLPPRQCWNMRAIDERILISETVTNQHCNGGMGENGNCRNSFDQGCRFDRRSGVHNSKHHALYRTSHDSQDFHRRSVRNLRAFSSLITARDVNLYLPGKKKKSIINARVCALKVVFHCIYLFVNHRESEHDFVWSRERSSPLLTSKSFCRARDISICRNGGWPRSSSLLNKTTLWSLNRRFRHFSMKRSSP